MKRPVWLSKFLIWRIRHISSRNFVMVLSGLVGVFGGLAAVTLKTTVHWIQESLRSLAQFGEDLNELDNLEAIKKQIDDLEHSASIIKHLIMP